MIAKSEQFILDSFRSNFGDLGRSAAPIVLYGIGDITRLLVENLPEFNFVGLMDRDSIGQCIYGLPVICADTAVKTAKCIVIVANMSVAPLIFRRIEHVGAEHGMDIFYINGERPCRSLVGLNPAETPATPAETLKNAIDRSDVVSFDLFDTLVMRRVWCPTDIFDMVGREMLEKYGVAVEFKTLRAEAEKFCYRNISPYINIHDVYSRLSFVLHCDDALLNLMKEAEIACELKCCTPRHDVVRWYEYAKQRGKTVLITTDTFLVAEYVSSLLVNCGISGFHRLLISCELKKLKHIGDMWTHVRHLYPGRNILHIGDNPVADVEMAQRVGVQGFKIENANEAVAGTTAGRLWASAQTLTENLLLGHIASKSIPETPAPFASTRSITIDSPYQLGYLCFGPLVLSFLIWLFQKSKECRVDRLLFFARDGYLLKRLYSKIADKLQVDGATPIYFLTSRRAASVAAIRDESDIEFIITHLCKVKKVRIRDVLPVAFGVSPEPNDPMAGRSGYEVDPEALRAHIIRRYGAVILENAESERRNYLAYIHSLDLKADDSIGCVNFVGRGITQRFVGDILRRPLSGFYFARELDMLDICPTELCHSLYGEYISPHVSRNHLASKYLYGEVVFSAPEEQLIRFETGGRPIFDSKAVRNFEPIHECHAGIEQLIVDMIAADERLLRRNINTDLTDTLYGLISEPSCRISDEVKRMFIFRDYYNPESPAQSLSLQG